MKPKTTIKQTISLLAILTVAFFTVAAGNHDHSKKKGHKHKKSKAKDKAKKSESTSKEKSTVSVPDDGKKFDPSIPANKVPKGAWFCEMSGKSHYAQGEKGKCPVCGMKLKKK
jgi:rubrerythrin